MIRRLAGPLALIGALACGAAEAPVTGTHAHFRAIQRQEARIDANRNVALAPTGDCPTACESAHNIAAAADRICLLAGDLHDPDAQARCVDAREAKREAGAATARCTCEHAADE